MRQRNANHDDGSAYYEVGTLMRYDGPDADEDIHALFSVGDIVRVLPSNQCGMGIDVYRLSDDARDMVFPTEVTIL